MGSNQSKKCEDNDGTQPVQPIVKATPAQAAVMFSPPTSDTLNSLAITTTEKPGNTNENQPGTTDTSEFPTELRDPNRVFSETSRNDDESTLRSEDLRTSSDIKPRQVEPSSSEQHGGKKNKKMSSKNRYSKYNIMNEMQKAEKDFLGGFNSQTHSEIESSDENKSKSIKHIRNIIMEELDNLNKESLNHGHLHQIGAGCDCDKKEETQKGGNILSSSSSGSSSSFSSSDSSDASRKKSKKNKKYSKQSRSKGKKSKNSFLSDSDSDSDSDSNQFEGRLVINSENETSNNSYTEEGLSIFPFNSSDVKSSISDKHQKILRRKL